MSAPRSGLPLLLSIGLGAVAASAPEAGLAQNVEPIRFTQNAAQSDLRVFFIDNDVLADEHWHVSGSCEGAPRAAKIFSATEVTEAEIRVAFTELWIYADRMICVMNPDDAPEEFWKIYEK